MSSSRDRGDRGDRGPDDEGSDPRERQPTVRSPGLDLDSDADLDEIDDLDDDDFDDPLLRNFAHAPAIALSAFGEAPFSPAREPTPRERAGGVRPSEAPESDRFVLKRRIAKGGMGIVYEAYDCERSAVVALKTLPHLDTKSIQRLKREFRAVADLVHPNLVLPHELVATDGQCFFTMELIDGVDFLTYVRAEPAEPAWTETVTSPADQAFPSPARAAWSRCAVDVGRLEAMLGQLASGLGALHRTGRLHCDIKPSNVMVTSTGRLVILDFGLASDSSAGTPEGAADEFIGGTPAYMSPEQATGRPLSPASDWYSVGVMLFQALTGRLPFNGGTSAELAAQRAAGPPPPASFTPGLPAALCDLCVRLLAPDPAARPSRREVSAVAGGKAEGPPTTRFVAPQGPPPFVGRAEHLQRLRDCFQEARGARAVAVHVRGRSGMGKTALVSRFLAELDPTGAVVLAGRCYERESVAYNAFDSLIDALGDYLRRLPDAELERVVPADVHALVRLFPALRRIHALASAPPVDTGATDVQALRFRGFAALKALLRGLAATRTLVVHIDDLQWGDADSAALLLDLFHAEDPPPLLLVATLRSEDAGTSPFLRALAARAEAGLAVTSVVTLDVGPMGWNESMDLATRLLPRDDPRSRGRAQAIARESLGSPLFVRELVRYLAERRYAGASSAEEITLDGVVAARCAGLSPEVRGLLEIVAVARGPVEQQVALRAAGIPRDEVAPIALLRGQHLVRTRGVRERDIVETYHDRIRELVFARLDRARRVDCHARLALALEASAAPDPEQLVAYFEGAENLEKAAVYAEQAAEKAAQALAFGGAARLFTKALELVRPDDARRSALEQKLGDALANAGCGADSARAYERAARGAAPAAARDLRRQAAEQLLRSGHVDEGIAVLRDVLAPLGMRLPGSPRAAVASLLAHRAELRLRGFSFRERAAAEVPPEVLARIDAAWSATVGFNSVDVVQAADFATRTLLLALRAGEPYRIARALAFEAAFTSMAGGERSRRVRELVRLLWEIADRIEHPHTRGLAMLASGVSEAFSGGHWRRALGWYRRAEEAFQACTGVAWEIVTTHVVTSWALFNLGQIGELARHVPAVVRAAEQRGDLYAQTILVAPLSWLSLAADDPASARANIRAALARWSRSAFHLEHFVALLAETYTDRYVGDAGAAWARLEAQWEPLEASLQLRVQNNRLVAWIERACTALALAEQLRGREKLLASAERDAASIAREGMSWSNPFVYLVRAGILLLRGERDRALSLLGLAATGFEAADMSLFAAAARRRRGELLGGEGGHALVKAADDRMARERIVDPARWAAMLAPGFGPR